MTYNLTDFETWLNSNSQNKAGLRGWWWIINKIKNDTNLYNSLATGTDQGGWEVSNLEWRKKYSFWGETFDDYYQVFLKWKSQVDSQELPEREENTEEKPEPSREEKLITEILIILDASQDKSEGEEKEEIKKIIKRITNNGISSKTQHQLVRSLVNIYPSLNQPPLTDYLKQWKELLDNTEEETEETSPNDKEKLMTAIENFLQSLKNNSSNLKKSDYRSFFGNLTNLRQLLIRQKKEDISNRERQLVEQVISELSNSTRWEKNITERNLAANLQEWQELQTKFQPVETEQNNPPTNKWLPEWFSWWYLLVLVVILAVIILYKQIFKKS